MVFGTHKGPKVLNLFPLILKRSPPPSPLILKLDFGGSILILIRGVSGACGHDWPLSLKSLNCSREPQNPKPAALSPTALSLTL